MIIRSRDNPRVKRWAKLVADTSFRRREGRALVEGPHLVAEALAAGLEPLALLVSEAATDRPQVMQIIAKREVVVLSDPVFRSISDAETPAGIAAEVEIPRRADGAEGPAVFLEGIQDPGNVGAIVRSAAAFGVAAVVHDPACADPWGPKALRAAQGGHFKLALRQTDDLGVELRKFSGRLVCTVVMNGTRLRDADLDGRIGWIFGAEGRGVSDAVAAQAALRVTIPMARGTESVNVAAAAAICLYEAFSRRAG